MKKWMKHSLIGAGVLIGLIAPVAAVIVNSQWDSITVLQGTQRVSGVAESVPETGAAELPPLTDGAADWTCWRGARGDGRSLQTGIITQWSDGLTKLWAVDYLCHGDAAATW